ncbi:MAG: hypothetical protein KIS66_04420 [Fimbriimonadaceae bacterium]|nr:hypothetical protein [Fimbriimonadaceae bacterium]
MDPRPRVDDDTDYRDSVKEPLLEEDLGPPKDPDATRWRGDFLDDIGDPGDDPYEPPPLEYEEPEDEWGGDPPLVDDY